LTIPVSDPFGVAHDSQIQAAARALDASSVQVRLGRGLPRLAGERGFIELRAIRVVRHKRGRRALIEYDVEVHGPGGDAEAATLIGKLSARRSGESGYRLLDSFWNAGFASDSEDAISVPEPIGAVPEWRLWLQRKVPGRTAAELLRCRGGVALAQRIADAAHKVHQTGIPTTRRHAMADELRILHDRLAKVHDSEPRWRTRIGRVIRACDRLGAATPPPALRRGIHRDFYPDQVIVNGARLYLLDFDEYCEGDPAIDVGNCIGALTELSVRTFGDHEAFAPQERAMEERFVELAGDAVRPAVRSYALLTLVRHISISTQFPERRRFTERLLDLCEERLEASLSQLHA
jgi:hypothetical protein